jgi:2-dehydro-3-deoxyphosphooctonate aldolase (KDO 8-P synthase)
MSYNPRMPQSEFMLGSAGPFGNRHPFLLIAGPCVIESLDMCVEVAGRMRDAALSCGHNYVFKASYDKANRSSIASFRGPGLDEGLKILAAVKQQANVPVLSDIHDVSQAAAAAEVLDIMQIPAFLCRQTDLLIAAAETGRIINVKKGQFMAPWDMLNVWEKLEEGGCRQAFITERGASFGYNNLVVDMRSILYFREQNIPVCMDATHGVQLPGGAGTSSSGQRQYIEGISRAAVSLGLAALFWEVHPHPEQAKSDGPNQIHLAQAPALLARMAELDRWAKANS